MKCNIVLKLVSISRFLFSVALQYMTSLAYGLKRLLPFLLIKFLDTVGVLLSFSL